MMLPRCVPHPESERCLLLKHMTTPASFIVHVDLAQRQVDTDTDLTTTVARGRIFAFGARDAA